ncbi:hypothetical protein COO91_01153 [Nostoc flagelliforme CCNUN1]|uniref:Uncharacterized protein n=1 Tax=Nostoc flagelliforme CCNUN1 TaxID=2038116 RepID=A0A2K8SIM4_9NOSO|nr:hypothetical protein COO91_01153 [Nostoc flagelliforme CCNUN1]
MHFGLFLVVKVTSIFSLLPLLPLLKKAQESSLDTCFQINLLLLLQFS